MVQIVVLTLEVCGEFVQEEGLVVPRRYYYLPVSINRDVADLLIR